jgi:hypothetical protein
MMIKDKDQQEHLDSLLDLLIRAAQAVLRKKYSDLEAILPPTNAWLVTSPTGMPTRSIINSDKTK